MTGSTDPGPERIDDVGAGGHRAARPRRGRARRQRRHPRWGQRTLATLLAALLLIAVPASTGLLTQASADTNTPGDWQITPRDGGWRVTLRLDAPLPVRAAQPTLIATSPDPGGNGSVATNLGVATAVDGDPTLVALVTDAPIAGSGTVTAVTLGWDGEATAEALDGGPTTLPAPPPGPALSKDPLAAGTHPVGTASYNLGDEAVDLAGLPGRRGEMRGVVYYPADRGTPAPVVLIIHGRHEYCADGQQRWPCTTSGDIPSYLGYQQTGQLLASQGFVVVSISANAVNAYDTESLDGGNEARAGLVLQTLDRLAAANDGGSPGFPGLLQGRLDLTSVGLMGHSRGGEAVVRAAQLNGQRAKPYGIHAVLPLAPTDAARLALPGIPMATLLPYCDGDVPDLSGQVLFDDSRHAFTSNDSVLRASLLMLGANHNYFNTVWSPGGFPTKTSDDWSDQDKDQSNPVCGESAAGRLSQADQRKAGAGYASAFFRLTLADDTAFLPMFDGSAPKVPTIPADVRVLSQAPSTQRKDLARFDTTPAAPFQVTGSLTADVCAGWQSARREPLPPCTYHQVAQVPHWASKEFTPNDGSTPMLHVAWENTGGTLTVPVTPASPGAYDALSIWLGAGERVEGTPADVGIDVVGTSGTVAVPADRILPATSALPGERPLGKLLLRQIHVPTADLAGIGDIQALRITGRSGSSDVYLSDVALVSPAVGIAASTFPPALRIAPTSVRQDRLRAGAATVAVVLDHIGTAPAAGHWASTMPGGVVVGAGHEFVVPAGQRCLTLTLPAETGPGEPQSTTALGKRQAVVAALTGAIPGALVTPIRVQDSPVDGLDIGVPGDACAEATATPGIASVSPASAAPGGTVTVTGTGFRSGESVLFAIGSGPSGARATAGSDGTVKATLTVPGDLSGAQPVTLTGYGSNRISSGGLQVVAGPSSSTSTPTSSTPTSGTPTSSTPTSSTPTSSTPTSGTPTSSTPTSSTPTSSSPTSSPPTSPSPSSSDPNPDPSPTTTSASFTFAPITVDPVTFPADPVTFAQWSVPYVDPGYASAVPLAAAPTTTTGAYSTLAQTGFRVAAVVIPALLLLAGGAALVMIGRRSGAHGSGRRR